MTRFTSIRLIYTLLVVVLGAVSSSFAQGPARQNDPQGYVESLISDLVSSDGQKVDVFGLSVGITGNVIAERATVSDIDGVWLEIDGFSLDWQPLSLFQNTLQVNSLDVKLLTVMRWPSRPVTESTTDPPAPRPVDIGRLEIRKITLAEALVGVPAELTARATARITNDPVRIAVDAEIKRIDDIAGEFAAKIDYEPETEQLGIEIRGSDGPAGLISNLLNIPGRPQIDLTVAGNGTLDRWDGAVSLNTGAAQTLGGEIRVVAVGEGRRLGAALEGSVSAYLPATIRPGFQGRSTLAGSLLIPADDSPLKIETLFLETPTTRLDLSGTVDRGGNQVNLRLKGTTPATETRLAVLSGDDRYLSAANLQVDAALSGSLDNPQWSLVASAAKIVAGPDTITNLQVAGASEPSGSDDSGFALNIGANVDTRREDAWADAIRGPVEFAGRGVYGKQIPLNLNSMTMVTPAGRIEAEGSLQPAAGILDLSIDAVTNDLKLGIGLLDRLLAGEASITGQIAKTGAAESITLTSVRLMTAAVNVSLDGEADGDAINLKVDGQFTDLSRLSARAAGRARFEAALSGPMTDISVSLSAEGDGIILSGKPFDAAAMNFNGTLGPDNPTGSFSLSGRYQGAPVRAGFDLRSGPDGARLLSNLQLVMAGAEMSGEISLPRDNGPNGSLAFNAPDLSPLGGLLLIDLKGSLEGSMDIAGGKATDQAVIRATGRNIRVQDISVSALDANVTVPDIRRPSQMVGKIAATRVGRGRITFESLTIEAARQGDGFAATFAAVGNPIDGSASAMITAEQNGTSVVFDRAEMNVYGVPIELARPARLLFAGKVVAVDAAVLSVGTGTVAIDGTYGDDADLRIDIRDISLAAIDAIPGGLGLAGSLSGNAALSRSGGSLKVSFDLSAAQATAETVRQAGIRPIDFIAKGSFEKGIVSFQSMTVDPGGTRLEVAGRIMFGDSPSLDLHVGGTMPLGFFADELARNGLRAAGTLTPDLTISGPLSDPNIRGSIDIDDATFGDAEGRFTVKETTARLIVEGDNVELVRMNGNAAGGSLSASGRAGLQANTPIEGNIEIRNGRYVDGTMIISTFDADLQISGTRGTGILIGGDITLLKTTITLDTLPPAANQLEDIRHKYPPAPVSRQWALLQQRKSRPGAAGPELDLTLKTENPILVRGRGINADFTGQLKIAGSADKLQPSGHFKLLRGTLTIVGRRLAFDRGTLEFSGNVNPDLDISATGRTSDATVTLTVSGTPDNPEITIASVPEMPAEEALANLVFQQSSAELSPIQLARLADAILVLNGGTRSGLFESLRRTLGIDRLDVNTQSDGTTTVGVGRYLNERTYIGAEQGLEEGTTKVTIDIDITGTMKLRTGAASDGETEAGIVFEKEY